MKKIFWFPALAVASLLAAGGALAHDDAHLDTQQAPHGGQLRMAGVYHFELVLDHSSPEPKDKPVLVYLTDHAGQKISAAGATGTATLLSGKTRATVALTPDGDNRLKGVGTYASTPGLKAVVSVTLAGKAPEQARFTPLAGAAK
ncbi:MAG: hypothetical protein KBF40_00290 [Giesbergeria sp.]|nr:hypothetical protein [Giesbergeria sp.]MBP6160057.1 hypothetical protein [Giesbergeria sp.]MBP7084566.1 hypothetical protein [Giesbergeria sp.]MBP9783166.1 hypothetical protein [Giesbergeria sp.]MBP9893761.1 hypothetical protein [Giesbergeria sp.]